MRRKTNFFLAALLAVAFGLAACASTSEGWLQVKSVGDARINVNYFANRPQP